jgi:hypothetical protein
MQLPEKYKEKFDVSSEGPCMPPPQALVVSWEGHDFDDRQIVCDLPMTQRGPAEEAAKALRRGSRENYMSIYTNIKAIT